VKEIESLIRAFLPDAGHSFPFLIGSNSAQWCSLLVLGALEINEHHPSVLLVPDHVPRVWIAVENAKIVNGTERGLSLCDKLRLIEFVLSGQVSPGIAHQSQVSHHGDSIV
jgi:hypothetical protein